MEQREGRLQGKLSEDMEGQRQERDTGWCVGGISGESVTSLPLVCRFQTVSR